VKKRKLLINIYNFIILSFGPGETTVGLTPQKEDGKDKDAAMTAGKKSRQSYRILLGDHYLLSACMRLRIEPGRTEELP